ncbi:fibronectin type III domain-containing protein [Aquimarina pacifica]|uniref:fibronectin type III domain-containing protein n=1 Tax=Aquimarina pacifica TaxID=1296415 RepID=UPI00047220E0|nr:fibronectin type III domain-containing protein [Aquimarina pacifica]
MKKLILILLVALSCASQAVAQRFPITVVPQVNSPAPVNFYNYADGTTINSPLRVQLLLSDITIINEQIRLKIYFEGNGIAFESRDVVVGAPSLFIEGGIPLTLTNVDLAPYFEFQNIQGINSSNYASTIPEGSYQFCFEVFDFSTGNRLSSKTCANTYIFKNDPPILNLPFDGSNIEPTDVENIVFQWTPRHINVSNVEYELSIVEIWDDFVDPQTAFLSLPPVFQTTTRGTSFVYGPTQPLLLPEKRYAWQVRAKALQGAEEIGLFRNEGKSEVFWFSRTSSCVLLPNVYAEPKGISKINVFWDEDPTTYTEYTIAYREANNPDANWFTEITNSGWTTIWDLKPGTTYEYKVKAKCKYQYGAFSEVQEVTTEVTQDEEADYNCGITPDAIAISNRNPHPGLSVGDRIRAGSFIITLTEITSQSDGRITGTGYVGIPYLKRARFGVTYSNVLINTDKQLAEGEIVTMYDEKFGEGEEMTVDVDIDVVDIIYGSDGESSIAEVDFVIESIEVNENGAFVITGTNGEEAIVPGGNNVIIKDEDDKVWEIGSDGSITQGQVAEGGAVTEDTTIGLENGEIAEISATGVRVNFEASGFYSYDVLPDTVKNQLGAEYITLTMPDDGIYNVPFKAVSDTNGEDTITAEAAFSDASLSTDDIIFKTKNGAEVPATWNGNTATLKLTKKSDYLIEQIVASVKLKGEDKYAVAGAFNLVHMGSSELSNINLVIVPINDVSIEANLKGNINEVYRKSGVNFNISLASRLQVPESVWDVETADQTLNAGDSGLLSTYSAEEKAIIAYFKTQRTYSDNNYYLFLTDLKATDSNNGEDIDGFMPLKKQYGFVFQKSTNQARTIAHEIGHGVFGLEHPFKKYGTPKGSTDFLMDYNGGTTLNHMDWKKIHAPGLQLYWFQDDEEGASVVIGSYFRDYKFGENRSNTSAYDDSFTFLTPSAEAIVLPNNVENVEFYYGYYGESIQGEIQEFIKFTPGTLKSFKIGDLAYNAKVQFSGDTATLLGYYAETANGPVAYENNNGDFDFYSVECIFLTNHEDSYQLMKTTRFDTGTVNFYEGGTSELKDVVHFPVPSFNGSVLSKKLDGYAQLGSDTHIVTNDIIKWSKTGHVLGNFNDIFIRTKIAELRAAFPTYIDYVTTDHYGKWSKTSLINGEYWEWSERRFLNWLSDKYLDCKDQWVGNERIVLCKLKDKYVESDLPNTQIDFLKEFILFIEQGIQEEAIQTEEIIASIKEDIDYVDTVDIENLIRAINFATTADIYSLSGEDVVRILSRMAYEGIFEGSDESNNRETAIIRLIEDANPSEAATIILGLEDVNYYKKSFTGQGGHTNYKEEILYYQIFTKVDDKLLGFLSGDNERARLIVGFSKLFMKATELHEDRKTSFENNLYRRSFVLEYQNIAVRAVNTSALIMTQGAINNWDWFKEKTTYFSIDTDYDSATGKFQATQNETQGLVPHFLVREKGEFMSDPLRPFDLVYFHNKSNLDVLQGFGKTESQINLPVPAILLMYADISASNQTTAASIITAVDVLSLATGPGALLTAGSKIHKAAVAFDMAVDLLSIATTATSDTDFASENGELYQNLSNFTIVQSFLSFSAQSLLRSPNNLPVRDYSLDDIDNAVPNSPMPDPIGLVRETDELPDELVLAIANDPKANTAMGYVTGKVDTSPNITPELKVQVERVRTRFERATELLRTFPIISKVPGNIEVLAQVSRRFEYEGNTGFEGLTRLMVDGSPASKQKLIDGLKVVDNLFPSSIPVQFSGIKNGEVIVRLDPGLTGGNSTEIGRYIDGNFQKKNFIDEADVPNYEVVTDYRGEGVLLKNGNTYGFRNTGTTDNGARHLRVNTILENIKINRPNCK